MKHNVSTALLTISIFMVGCSDSSKSNDTAPKNSVAFPSDPTVQKKISDILGNQEIQISFKALKKAFSSFVTSIPDNDHVQFQIETRNPLMADLDHLDPCYSGAFNFQKTVSWNSRYLDSSQYFTGDMSDYTVNQPENCEISEEQFKTIQDTIQSYLEDVNDLENYDGKGNDINYLSSTYPVLSVTFYIKHNFQETKMFYHYNGPKQEVVRLNTPDNRYFTIIQDNE